MYLFKRASNNQWVFGPSANSDYEAGEYHLETNADGTLISIVNNELPDYKPVNNVSPTLIKKEDGTFYASFADFYAACAGFFTTPEDDINKRLIGYWGDKVNPAGSAKYSAPEGNYFYACNCRVDGTIIASLEKKVGAVVSADATDSYIGVAMYQGEYHPFVNKIVSVTLTGGSDQLQLWYKPF
jgi:hypothetical protein